MTDEVDSLDSDRLAESRGAVVFVADASAEAERVARALKAEGYRPIDVPISFLLSRVASQRPEAIVLDGDAEDAPAVLARLREHAGPALRVFVLGREGGAFESAGDAEARGATGFFARPVDQGAVVSRFEALVPVVVSEPVRPSSPPPSSPSRPHSSPPSLAPPPRPDSIAGQIQRAAAQVESEPLSSSAPPSALSGPPSAARSSLLDAHIDPVAWAGASVPVGTALSDDLARLLSAAESRVGASLLPSSEPPSPEEEVDRVLPPEILAELDEPMGLDDDDRSGSSLASTPGTPGAATSLPDESSSRRQVTPFTGLGTGAGGREPSRDLEVEPETRRPPATRAMTVDRPEVDADASSSHERVEILTPVPDEVPTPVPPPRRTSSWPAPPIASVKSVPEPKPQAREGSRVAQVLGDGEAAKALAQAVAERHSGSLCFDDGSCLRRAVLRDGDFVTAASTSESETVLAFLAELGELPQDLARRLAGKMPPFGRHAGAALVAHGHLAQDRLWDVLRSHAEWILTRILVLPGGACVNEVEPPGRLKGEPAVFGGSAGAEVLVELARRAFPPEVALARLGGAHARFDRGPRIGLLAECALSSSERELIERSMGNTVGEVAVDASPDLASALVALADLGVITVLAAGRPVSEVPAAGPDPLDEDAVRARVRARLALVEEGDYFAVLGVPMAASPYDIRRAYLELRRSFEVGRLLTASTVDLRHDVQTIVEVLDEAYEILKDPHRRERYRRAISATPRS